MMRNPSNKSARRRATWWSVPGVVLAVLIVPAIVRAAPTTGSQTQDMSGILGPGSQLMCADNGEFEILFDADNQLGHFRATRDVLLITKEIEMRCEELIYGRAAGTIDARAKPGKLVRIKMLGSPGAGDQKAKQDVDATCARYKMLIDDKRHILTGRGQGKPEVLQTNEKGEVMAFSGTTVTMSQRASGAWRIDVKGEPEIYNPKERHKLQQARRNFGAAAPGRSGTGAVATKPTPTPAPVPPKKTPVIETETRRKPRPTPRRVVKIDEGG